MNFLLRYCCHVAGEKPRQVRLTGDLSTRLLVRPHVRNVKLHYALLLASSKLVSVNIPAKNCISNKVCCVCANTYAFKHGDNLPRISGIHWCPESWDISVANYNLSSYFGWIDQSADLAGFEAHNLKGQPETTGFIQSQDEKVKEDITVFFIYTMGTSKEDRARLLEVYSERKEATETGCSQKSSN